MERKRICINFERVRVVEYIQIVRCFKCQQFGHRSNNCEKEQVCPKCAGNHTERECKSLEIKCNNCYFGEAELDTNHRADSIDCESYKSYRANIIRRL